MLHGKVYVRFIVGLLFLLFVTNVSAQTNRDKSDIWVSAYFAAWNHYAPPGGNWGVIPTDSIDWDAFTHMIYFALNAKEGGELSKVEPYHNLSPSRLESIVEAAHRNNTPILISIGGWGNYQGFSDAIRDSNRQKFIDNLVQFIKKWKFDGIDLDMEPIRNKDTENYRAFVNNFHDTLQQHSTPLLESPLLTAATGQRPKLFASLKHRFDQINLMTYDMSGAWPGWVTWHNAPIYNGGLKFPVANRTLPSANKSVEQFVTAGVDKSKLGIGIDFYGYIWEGVAEPLESWTAPPLVRDNIPYRRIKNKYYRDSYYRWDTTAAAAYLSINDGKKKQFVSFDSHRTVREKVKYSREKGIGGLIVWELGGGYFPENNPGKKDPLLQEVKNMTWGGDSPTDRISGSADSYKLESNYPNPFNPSTNIKFTIPEKTKVTLSVYAVNGKKVETLVDQTLYPGTHVYQWHASSYASGNYLYRLETSTYVKTRKMTLIK